MTNGKCNFFFVFYTLHFPHSEFLTLHWRFPLFICYTPHFPHSAFSSLHSALSTLRIFYAPHFPHSSFSKLRTKQAFHTPYFLAHTLHFPHSAFFTLRYFLLSTLSTLRIFYTPHFHTTHFYIPHFPHSVFSTYRIFHTPHFPATLRIFYTPHFLHFTFSTLPIFYNPLFPHSALTPRIPRNPLFVIQVTAVFRRCSHLHELLATLLTYFAQHFWTMQPFDAWNKCHFSKFFLGSL